MNFKNLLAAVILCGLIVACASCSGSPDTVITITDSSFTLSNGIKVEAEEKKVSGFRDTTYDYQFTVAGVPVASSSRWRFDMPVKTGQSQGIPYFYQKNMICIFSQPKWIVWDGITGEYGDRYQGWWPYKKLPQNDSNGPLDWYEDFRITNFTVRGNVWIITIQTGTASSDWSGGEVPPFVYLMSRDFGKSWNVKGDTRKSRNSKPRIKPLSLT